MAIYGTALLSLCLIIGLLIGKMIGHAMGINANVGGVGIAMLLLIVCSGHLHATGRMPKPTQSGVLFWSSIYIPVVIAMAAKQNVVAAVSGGAAAIIAGVLTVLVCFALVPLISQIGDSSMSDRGSLDPDSSDASNGDAP